MTTKVVHCKKTKEEDVVYIGRPSLFGNLWSHKEGTSAKYKVATRQEAIENYRRWLLGTAFKDVEPRTRELILNQIPLLKNKTLSCWCYPEACHGDVLAEMADTT